jgi:hypothetical protein
MTNTERLVVKEQLKLLNSILHEYESTRTPLDSILIREHERLDTIIKSDNND